MAKRAAQDVRAMVRDRRNGHGKANGAPAHLPILDVAADHLSEDEAALLRHLRDEWRETGAAAEASQGKAEHDRLLHEAAELAIGGAMRHLNRKYGMSGKDSVDIKTGAITRAPK